MRVNPVMEATTGAWKSAPPLEIRERLVGVRDVLGPGFRAVVWVQGCTIRCPGCMVPETWTPGRGQRLEVEALANELFADERVVGLTVSGGEPTEQPEAVAELLIRAHAAGKDTWLYTGRRLEALVALDDPRIDRLLAHVDVLVDGAFERDRATGTPYRGSGNQRLIRLGQPRLPPIPTPPRVQLFLDDQGLTMVGVPDPGFQAAFPDPAGHGLLTWRQPG
jgi:anaerobic ribonucleoside-triphosphate reductase activating protein